MMLYLYLALFLTTTHAFTLQIPAVKETSFSMIAELSKDASSNVHSLQSKTVVNGKSGPTKSCIMSDFLVSKDVIEKTSGTFDTKEIITWSKEMKTKCASSTSNTTLSTNSKTIDQMKGEICSTKGTEDDQRQQVCTCTTFLL